MNHEERPLPVSASPVPVDSTLGAVPVSPSRKPTVRGRDIGVTRTLDDTVSTFLAGINGVEVRSLPENGKEALAEIKKRFKIRSDAAARLMLAMVAPPDRVSAAAAFNRTRHAMLAMRPMFATMLLEKAARGKDCPYDRDILLALAKSHGLLVETSPVDAKERERMEEEAVELSEMTREKLAERVLDKIRSQHGDE